MCNDLCDAIEDGKMDLVDCAVKMGTDVNQQCKQHETSLTQACASGNKDLLKNLLQQKACVNGSVQSRCTPLMAAVQGKHVDILQCLLENDANPNVQTLEGKTALHKAVLCEGNAGVTLVQLLLKRKAELLPDKYGNTPLSLAVQRGRVDILDLLLGVQPMSREDRINAMELCAAFRAPEDMAKVFEFLQRAMKERYKDPSNILHKPDQFPEPSLGYVVESRSPQELSERNLNHAALLIECLAIRKRRARHPGSSMKHRRVLDAYYWLFNKGHHKEVCFILGNETDLAIKFIYDMLDLPLDRFAQMPWPGETAKFALFMMYLNAVRTHLKNRVQRGKCLDIISTCRLVKYVLKLLSTCNVHVDVGNSEDVRVLKETAKDISDCLQCDYHPVNTHSILTEAVISWEFCTSNFRKSLLENVIVLLIQSGASLDCRDLEGNTPLHILAKSGDEAACSMARLLWENGADLDFLDSHGRTPAQCAVTEKMKTLLESIPRPLQCLAVNTILKDNLNFDLLPNPLKRFVAIHSESRVYPLTFQDSIMSIHSELRC